MAMLITAMLVSLATAPLTQTSPPGSRAHPVPFPGWGDAGKGSRSGFIRLPSNDECRVRHTTDKQGRKIAITQLTVSSACRCCWPKIRRIVRRRLLSFKHCYETYGLRDNPTLKGSVTYAFQVTSGRVTKAHVASTSLRHPATQRCVLAAFRRLQFSERAAACPPEVLWVRYPLHFSPRPKPRPRFWFTPIPQKRKQARPGANGTH